MALRGRRLGAACKVQDCKDFQEVKILSLDGWIDSATIPI